MRSIFSRDHTFNFNFNINISLCCNINLNHLCYEKRHFGGGINFNNHGFVGGKYRPIYKSATTGYDLLFHKFQNDWIGQQIFSNNSKWMYQNDYCYIGSWNL